MTIHRSASNAAEGGDSASTGQDPGDTLPPMESDGSTTLVSENPPSIRRAPAEILGSLNDVEEKHAPSALYLAGNLKLLDDGPRVSVVGSRKASPEGLRRAASLSKALVDHGILVVSGLAEGIDTAAHTAAIAAGGHTMAVIGTPLDQFYPKENRALQEQLIRDQLVVSQFPSGYRVTPKNFPIRNRTMALLSDATVIIEAGETSGTVHQGWEALRLGRLLFLLESVATDSRLSWPKKMIHYGAQVLSRNNLEAALSDIPAVTQRLDGDFAQFP